MRSLCWIIIFWCAYFFLWSLGMAGWTMEFIIVKFPNDCFYPCSSANNIQTIAPRHLRISSLWLNRIRSYANYPERVNPLAFDTAEWLMSLKSFIFRFNTREASIYIPFPTGTRREFYFVDWILNCARLNWKYWWSREFIFAPRATNERKFCFKHFPLIPRKAFASTQKFILFAKCMVYVYRCFSVS